MFSVAFFSRQPTRPIECGVRRDRAGQAGEIIAVRASAFTDVISAFSAFFSGDAQPVIAATATSATRPFVMTMNSGSEVVSRTPPLAAAVRDGDKLQAAVP
jgi:hypothetical protein